MWWKGRDIKVKTDEKDVGEEKEGESDKNEMMEQCVKNKRNWD